MVAVVGVHGADDAEIVNALADFGEDLADFEAGLAVAFELPGRAHERAAGTVGADLGAGHGLAIVLSQGGLGVEGIYLRHAAIQKQEDDVFGFGGEMGCGLQDALRTHQAEAAAELPEKLSPVKHS